MKPMNLGSRIKQARQQRGIELAELARRSNVPLSTLFALEERDSQRSKFTPYIASALGMSVNDLLGIPAVVDATPALIRGQVPLISWTTAGNWADVEDPFAPGDADEWIPTNATVGPNAFALRVIGDSMEPTIANGAIVIIDPAREGVHNKIVLAKRTDDQKATLKRLWFDGETPYLKPDNDRFPIQLMTPGTRIIGVAVRVETDL